MSCQAVVAVVVLLVYIAAFSHSPEVAMQPHCTQKTCVTGLPQVVQNVLAAAGTGGVRAVAVAIGMAVAVATGMGVALTNSVGEATGRIV